jgi:hypothetical protein
MPINQVVRGIFNGTGAIANIGIGFIPTYVKLWNITEATYLYQIGEWQKGMFNALKTEEGLTLRVADDTDADASDLTTAGGIKPYRGGDVGNGTETYLIADPEPDKRAKGAGVAIDKWTLDTPANRTGHWNDVCSLTVPNQVGVGSIIKIDSGAGMREYHVQAITSNGEVADEITLNEAAPSGKIGFLGGIHTWVQCPSGLIVPAGFTIAALAEINTNDEIMVFEAGH